MLARRVNKIHSEGIQRVFKLARTKKNIINLSIGQPDFKPPMRVKQSMIKAIRNNNVYYTQSGGIKELRDELSGLTNKPVMLTCGVSGGLFLTYSVLLNPNDELIILDPYFASYPDLCEFLGAKARIVKTNNDFSINPARIKRAINNKTKAIMINSPSNPSGHVLSRSEVKELVSIAKENNLWIISDEIYSDFVYDNEFISPSEYYDKTIVLNGFSKRFAIPGERLGYISAPLRIINELIRVQQYVMVNPPVIAQYGVLGNTNISIKKNINEYKNRASIVYETLKDYFSIIKPQGGFYAFPELPKGVNATEFVNECINEGVLVIPGNVFSKSNNHFRVSFTIKEELLIKGLKKIIKVIRRYK